MTLQLNKNRPTEISFDLEVEGLITSYLSSIDVRFNLINDSHNLSIIAKHSTNKTYNVLVPIIENCQTVTKFNIEVITQGYYFKPLEDDIVWVDAVEKVHISTPTVIKPQHESQPDSQSEPIKQEPSEIVNTNVNPKHDIGFVFANNTREFNFIDQDKLPKGVIGEEPPKSEPKQEVATKKPEYLGKKDTTTPKKDQLDKTPTPPQQSTSSNEEKAQKLRGVIADLQKEKEEKQRIKEESVQNRQQQKLLEKQAKINKVVETLRKEEKAKQIIAESRKS